MCIFFTAHVSLSMCWIQKVFKHLHFSSVSTTQYSSIAPNFTASKIICTHPADKGVSLTQQYEIIAKIFPCRSLDLLLEDYEINLSNSAMLCLFRNVCHWSSLTYSRALRFWPLWHSTLSPLKGLSLLDANFCKSSVCLNRNTFILSNVPVCTSSVQTGASVPSLIYQYKLKRENCTKIKWILGCLLAFLYWAGWHHFRDALLTQLRLPKAWGAWTELGFTNMCK